MQRRRRAGSRRIPENGAAGTRNDLRSGLCPPAGRSRRAATGCACNAGPVMTELSLVQAVNLALKRAMSDDARVLVLGEDVGVDGGVFRATDGLLQQFGAERVIDTPLAEASIAGVSIGLAAQGFVPVAEIQFT